MPTANIVGREVHLNDEGFMTDPSEWNEEIAAFLARQIGIDPLTNAQTVELCVNFLYLIREGWLLLTEILLAHFEIFVQPVDFFLCFSLQDICQLKA